MRLTTKACYNGSSILVHVLASTRNEPSHPVERTCTCLLVWPSPQSSLATGPCFVLPWDHDVTKLGTVSPDPCYIFKAIERGAKITGLLSPGGIQTPFPLGINCHPPWPPEVLRRGAAWGTTSTSRGGPWWTLVSSGQQDKTPVLSCTNACKFLGWVSIPGLQTQSLHLT